MSALAVNLKCGAQQYAWGKEGLSSKVAELLKANGQPVDEKKRYAELWIGTHPSMPSTAVTGSGEKPLTKHLEETGAQTLGEAHVKEFGKDIPFLLKVLSIDKALSIQAHPDLKRAKVLHEKDREHYPDPNHKPELVVALTPYQALCCFRPIHEISNFLKLHSPLRSLINNSEDIIAFGLVESPPTAEKAKELLKDALSALYSQPAETISASIDSHMSTIEKSPMLEDQVFIRIAGQFPGDVGCWMVYILNLVQLRPGDGLFLAPNEPHSYLSGDSVEIMAASDNVVRAGLTPKFKDVDTLLEMMTYRTDSLQGVQFTREEGASVQVYAPPAEFREFQLTSVIVEGRKEGSATVGPFRSAQLIIAVEGEGKVNGRAVKKGDTFFMAVGESMTVEVLDPKQSLHLFCGGTNQKKSNL